MASANQLLHVTSGSASARALAASGAVAGETLGFDEALIDGPHPVGGLAGKWQWRRSRHVATVYGIELADAVARQQSISALVARIVSGQRTVLWFESDLFCQANLAGLLYRLNANDLPFDAPLELVLVADGGFAAGVDWRAAFDSRSPVTPQMVADACDFWEAVGEPGRGTIERALQPRSAFGALPSLRRALDLELQRRRLDPDRPSSIESIVLDMVSDGRVGFDELFRHFSQAHARFGLGDWQFWNLLLRMSGCEPTIGDPGDDEDVDEEDGAAAPPCLLAIEGAPPSPAALAEGAFHHAVVRALQAA